MKSLLSSSPIDRRKFFKIITADGIASALAPSFLKNSFSKNFIIDKPSTNIKDALSYPRNSNSMPGKYPAKVVQVFHPNCIIENKINIDAVNEMVKTGITKLTGELDVSKAWLNFVTPNEIIGLKVNPVAGALLSTSLEIVEVVIKQLTAAGIPQKNILIWDRREFELKEVGFTNEKFPGIKIIGTEQKDAHDSFFDSSGKLYSENMIDKDWYYWADCEQKYDDETLPYMVNEGKYSYFTKIVTKEVDKIINIPILKNAGSSATLCLKNLAYGS
ncbi:MAG: hypothetical protein N3A61_09165, partial [Ignavibacteria bacterium]|nr:hypothetical protein [Ignavibacteria bacterium]